ncbi:RNA-directed DNA polymerase, eukaryota, partial [Tanacetum coccineum]
MLRIFVMYRPRVIPSGAAITSVVDSYIPVKKSKYGKRFGFVKFINVFSEERLVNNLLFFWIGRLVSMRYRSIPTTNGLKVTKEFGFDWLGLRGRSGRFEAGNSIREDFKSPHEEKEVSEDPFNVYSLLKRHNKLDDKDTNSEDSLKHPPGFTPLTQNCENDTSEKKVDQNDEFSEAGDVDKLKGSANGSISAGHFKVSEIPRTGGSMVGLLEDVIKVGQVMGFKMEGVIANLEELIGTQGGKEVIQETKMEKIEDFCVKQCWGNLVFDYVYSEAVENSGGKWRLTGKNMMIIGVYAPQEGKEKQALWDFLRFEVDKWNGDVIIMGDFNEVRVKSDRFGTHFNPHGAHRFNSFILDSGLVEVNLGGCRFTWCHRSATKMSKLDRFLVSESVISGSPNIKAVTLE